MNKLVETLINLIQSHTPLLYWTQSLWRDEAFSVWIAKDGIQQAIVRTSGDFNPPLYYILLSIWMSLFGNSEVALRGLSVMAFLLFLIVVYRFSRILFRSQKAAVYTTLLMLTNPMLVYFAFELRMYSLLILFTTLSMYMLYVANWKWYIISAVLGLYTQPFMAFVILSQSVYLLFTKRLRTSIRNGICIAVLYIPWLPTLITQFRASGPMWMYPVDLTLATSALGNVLLGYEGTPGNLWWVMQLVSLLIIICAYLLWRKKSERPVALFWLTWISMPLITVLAISLVKPIYVHRYVIYVTVAEVFLLAHFVLSINPRRYRLAFGGFILLLFLTVNFFTVAFHRKVPIRDTFKEINSLLKSEDIVYAETPLVFYESLYYTRAGNQVYLYNPHRITPPRYVGAGGMPETIWVSSPPQYPKRAFLVRENGQFYMMSTLITN